MPPEAGGENRTFLGNGTKDSADLNELGQDGCCRSKHTKNCCIATGVFGGIFIVIGIVVLVMGEDLLTEQIQKSMALTEGSDRFESWLHPPVQPHLHGYAFHVTNPEAVLRGMKPIVEEKGPYVYKSETLKDSNDNLVFNEDGTITYRPRKRYTYVPSLSGKGLDPFNDYLVVPNIPLWTGLAKAEGSFAKSYVRELEGLGTPFINVTFHGLLWGYEDELPCIKLKRPANCSKGIESPFSVDAEEEEEDDFDDDFFSDWRRRRKRNAEDPKFNPDKDPNAEHYGEAVPKAEFVNCKCNWGLFRDRNMTMREPIRFFSGINDLSLKGVVKEFNHTNILGWWEPGSICDKVKGQDSSTLPPGLTPESELEIFIALMCRTIKLKYEQDVTHANIKTHRYIPPPNALGAHDDENMTRRNPDNECYCIEGFKCFKSGVYNMKPCKREDMAPLALSMPHFYQADESFREAVGGMNPEKEKHQFYMDVVPEFGFPLAIRPRFQLNIVIGRHVDPEWKEIEGMKEEIVLPFLWAQDGFDEPSIEMAEQIRFGLSAPEKLPLMGSVVLFAIGALLLLICLVYFIWLKTVQSRNGSRKGEYEMTSK